MPDGIKFRLMVWLAGTCVFLSACHTMSRPLPRTVLPHAAVDPAVQRKFNAFFLEAVRQKEKGSYDAAFELLEHALHLNPDAPEALYEMAQIYRRCFPDSVTRIGQLHKRAALLDTTNAFYLEQLADFYLRTDSIAAAQAIYEDMARRFTDDSGVLMTLLGIYETIGDYKSMIRILDLLERREGKNEAISREKYKIYLQQKDEVKALREVNDLCREYPSDSRYRLMAADLHLQMSRPDSAYAIYRDVLSREPDNAMARLALMGYYGNTEQDSLYNAEVDSIVLNPHIETPVRAEAMKSLIRTVERKGGDSMRVTVLFKKALKLPQEDRSLPDLFQAYLLLKQAPADSIVPVWKQILSIEPEYDAARLQLLQYYVTKNEVNEVARLCQEGVQYDPSRLVYYFYGGVSLYQADRTDEAVSLLERGTDYTNDESEYRLASDLYALLGDIYHDSGHKEKAYPAYEKAIDLNADNRLCLNNYAYYLSLEGKNLDKAAEMSYRTVQAEPSNPTYLDTYAWILFKQGKYAEAKIYIDETLKYIEDKAENAGIIEHAGDIYAHTGHMKEAVAFWKRALRLGGETSHVLKKKISQKKYIDP